jgi:enamine deaminase RidA (YjgF/YER057c/UK114 family)
MDGGVAALSRLLGKQRRRCLPQREEAMIDRINVPGLKDWGKHGCHVTRAGPHVWVSGIVGMRPDGTAPADTAGQFDVAISILDECLRAAGADARHITKMQVYLTDISERPLLQPRRLAYFGEHPPASTLVEVSALADPRFTVEIDCQAYID